MARLRWTLDQRWYDGRRGIDVSGPAVYEVPEEVVDEYLEHPSGGWEHPWEEEEENEDGPEPLSREELEEKGYRELQSLAKERDIPANQSEEDLIDELADHGDE